MNRKRIILLFIVMLLCAGLWWKSRPATFSALENTGNGDAIGATIINNDRVRLERNLKPEVLADKKWPLINDYSLKPEKLVTKKNAQEFFSITHESAKNLGNCLKKDFCGMQTRGEEDAYFDDTRTPAHILLGRNLEIMLEALNNRSELKEKVDWDLIHSLTENSNEKVQTMALQIIKQYSPDGADTNKLLEIAENYKGQAKAVAFEKISQRKSPNDRLLLISWLEKSFAEDDPNSVISVIEKMKNMKFTTAEIDRISMSLCHFRENGVEDPNWKMIKYYMSSMTDLEQICN